MLVGEQSSQAGGGSRATAIYTVSPPNPFATSQISQIFEVSGLGLLPTRCDTHPSISSGEEQSPMPTNPADSPILGTLYGSDTMRAVFDERALFQRMLDVEAALARAQARLGVIPPEAAQSISRAARLENLDITELAESARTAGAPVVGVVAGLSRAAGDAGAWTHWGATTQDIVDTAIVLQIRDGLGLIRASLREAVSALVAQADRHRHTVMAGRTYLQQALPTTLGLKCAIWAQPLIGHVHRLDALR